MVAREGGFEALVSTGEPGEETGVHPGRCTGLGDKRLWYGGLCTLLCPVLCVFGFFGFWMVSATIAKWISGTNNVDYEYAFKSMGSLRSVSIHNVSADGPFILGTAPIPESLRGLFWLSEQGKSSALVSFGGPNADSVEDGGRACSSGELQKKFCVRVSGDRTWSMMSDTLAWVYGVHDFRYIFTLDDLENATEASIDPYADWGGSWPGYNVFFFARFGMSLHQNGHADYNGSYVWQRTSTFLGAFTKTYEAIQVMDEHGKKIEPAWSKFVDYEVNTMGLDVLYYHSYDKSIENKSSGSHLVYE